MLRQLGLKSQQRCRRLGVWRRGRRRLGQRQRVLSLALQLLLRPLAAARRLLVLLQVLLAVEGAVAGGAGERPSAGVGGLVTLAERDGQVRQSDKFDRMG